MPSGAPESQSAAEATTSEAAVAFLRLAEKLGDQDAASRVTPLIEQFRLGLFRLVVVGEIKKGKSSFINALLGEPGLVPTSDHVATSTVFKILYGERKAHRVFFLPDNPGRPEDARAPLEVGPERIVEFGTEDGNPSNAKRVDFVGVQLPHPALKSGLAVVDTPGLGGLLREHAEITWRHVPSADALFFVLDSAEAVVSRDEVQALERFLEFTPYVFFVQTKTDLVEEAAWRAWQERNLAVLGEAMGLDPGKVVYFPVSSALKARADAKRSTRDLERSGFAALNCFLQGRLMAAKKRKFGGALLRAVEAEAAEWHRRFSDEASILSAKTSADRDALRREYSAAKAKFDVWRETTLNPVAAEFQQSLVHLKRTMLERIQDELDPSPNGSLVRPAIDRLRQSGTEARAIDQQAGGHHAGLVDRCGRIIFGIQRSCDEAIARLVAETTARIGRSIRMDLADAPALQRVLAPSLEVRSLNMHFSRFEEARGAVYGGMAGGMMASLATSLVFPPLGLLSVLAYAGAVGFGAFKAHHDAQARRREEALMKLQNALADVCRVCQRQGSSILSDAMSEAERKAAAAFREALAAVEADLKRSLDAVAQAQRRSEEQSQHAALRVGGLLHETEAVLRAAAAGAKALEEAASGLAAPSAAPAA